MVEKGRMADKGGARETAVPIAKKKNTLYLNKEQVRETRTQAHGTMLPEEVRESYGKARRILTTKQK